MEVNLPSQQNQAPSVSPQTHPGSMHVVYGGAIIILALILIGIICVMGNVQIPYISAFYAPEVQPPVSAQTIHIESAVPATSAVLSATSSASSTTSTTASTTKKK